MDKRDIIDGLKATFGPAAGPEPQRSEHCLAPEALAAFLDGSSVGKEHDAQQAHLADCAYCLQQLAQISRSREGKPADAIHPDLLIQAEALGSQPSEAQGLRHRYFFGKLPAMVAIAATAVLAVGVLSLNPQNRTPTTAPSEEFRTTRYVDTQVLNPRLLAPTEDSVIVPAEQVFRWTEVPGSLFYDIRLMDPDGELLLRERVEATRWLIPDQFTLEDGEEYYVRVDAYLDDARFLSSEHIVFSVRSEP